MSKITNKYSHSSTTYRKEKKNKTVTFYQKKNSQPTATINCPVCGKEWKKK